MNIEELGYKKQDEIIVIEDPVTAVRQVPDVYLGALGNVGFLNMAREIIQNSLDEISKGYSLDKTIDFFYDARSHTIRNEDHGQGIELNKLVDVFSKLHSSSNYNKVTGSSAKSAGKNGQGSKIVNFLSKFFIVESYRLDGSAAKVQFDEGYLSKKGLQSIKCPKDKHGLVTSFSPSAMMGNITVSVQEIEHMLWMQCNIYPIGVKINYSAIDEQGNQYSNTIINKRGLKELLSTICEKEIFEPIYFNVNTPERDYECIFTYDVNNMNDPVIMPFANMCYTTGGTQVKGFLSALSVFFRKYMNTIYLVKNKKLQVNSTDITTGLRAVISSKSLTPIFTGQSKDYYSEVDMEGFAYSVTTNALTEWSKQQPSSFQKLCKYYKDVCEVRSKIDNEKIKMRDKYTTSALHNRPAKYKQPTNNHLPFEVVINTSPISW